MTTMSPADRLGARTFSTYAKKDKRMSAPGQERTLAALDFMSALPPITDANSGKTDIGNFMSAFGCKPDVI